MLDKLKYIDTADYYIGMKMNKPYLQGINLMLTKNKILKEKRQKIINAEWFHLFLKVHKTCKFKSTVFTAYLGDKIIKKSTTMIFIKVRIMAPSGGVEMAVIKENASWRVLDH